MKPRISWLLACIGLLSSAASVAAGQSPLPDPSSIPSPIADPTPIPSPIPDPIPIPDPSPTPDPSPIPPAVPEPRTAVPADQRDAEEGPAISVPPEVDTVPVAAAAQGAANEDETAFYGLKQQRIAQDSTSIGGYAELHYSLEHIVGPGESAATVDLHRMVLFVAHRFDQNVRFYTELEIEHAVTSGGTGAVDLEQAYLDWLLAGEALGLRAGVVLVPMGIVNEWHEPPIFHGVERPNVDRVIMPTTWREAGLGVFGEPVEGLRYQLYLLSGLDPSGFSAEQGIRGGRQSVSQAHADGLALSGRIEIEPVLGLVAGLSGYAGLAGPNAELFDAAGEPLNPDAAVVGGAADVRGRYAGLEARAVIALFGVGDTAELRGAFDPDGNPLELDVGSRIWGGYGELAFDVLHPLRLSHALLPFVRVERYDTLAGISGREEMPEDEAYGITELVAGLTYKPLSQVAFKGDFLLSSPDGPAKTQGRVELGLGLMF
jgi:hypothetical protein